MANQVAVDVELAWPYIQKRLERYLAGAELGSGGGGTVGALTAHDLSGPYHTGTLVRSQAPWVATDISAGIASHAALPDVHHARQHSITSSSDHTITGAALSVVGATAPDTLGIITPSANPGTTESLLKATSGLLTLPQFTATTKVVAPHYTSATSFTSGFTGAGVRLDDGVATAGKTTLELDEMIVRGRMRVYELLIHQIRATNGSVFVTGVGKVKTVSGSGPYTIETETDHGFATNDLIRAQRFTGSGVYQSNMQVTAVATTTQFTASLSSGDAPAAGMDFVRLGNTSDTDRQGSIYLTADDTYAPYIDILDGVSSFGEWGAATKIKVRLGRLDGISDAVLSPTGYGLYSQNAYLKGAVSAANDVVRLDGSGARVRATTGSTYASLTAYRFLNAGDVEIGGVYGRDYSSAFSVALATTGDATHTPASQVTSRGGAAVGGSAQVYLDATSQNAAKAANILLDVTNSASFILFGAADYAQFNMETRSSALHRPLTDLGANLGSATYRWGTIYVDQIIAGVISGDTMSGAEWEYAGSMVIDANNASNTTVTVVNQGAGGVTFNVDGTLQQGGVGVSLSGHTHDDRYYTESEVNSLLTGYVPTSRTVTAGSGLTGGGALSANITLSHADTSSQASVDNSGVNFIQDITLDTYGHVTAIGTASISSALDDVYVNVTGDTMTGGLTAPTVTTPALLAAADLAITPAGGDVTINAILSIPKAVATSAYNALIQLQDTGTAADSSTGIDWQNSTYAWNMGRIATVRYGSTNSFSLAFSTAPGGVLYERMRIGFTGNVLIGTTTDSAYKLDVAGTIRSTGIIYAGNDIQVTGEVLAANGTAGAPSIAALSDNNTGLYWSAADTLAVATGGVLRLSVSTAALASTLPVQASVFTAASGNVTVSAPATLLLNAATANTVDLQVNGVSQWSASNARLNPRSTVTLDIGDYNRKIRTLHAAELYVETLVAQDVMATIGGRVMVAPTTTLIADLASSAPSALYTNLIAYWKLDEVSGNRADSKGSNTLTDTNTVTSIAGKQSNAAVFTKANSEYLTATDNSSLSVGDIDFYMACWIYQTLDDDTDQYIAAKAGASGNRAWRMWIDDDLFIHFQVFDASNNNSSVTASSFGALTLNTWYFVEAWHDSVGNVIGVAVNTTSNTSAHTTGVKDDTGPFQLGADNGASFYQGYIDEFGFWKYMPASGDRTFLYNSGAGRTYTNISNWTTIDVKHNNLTAGTYIYMQAAPAGVAQIEALQVTATGSAVTGGYRYPVIRNLDGTGANGWVAGDAVVSLGSAVGQGYIDLTSTSTIHSHLGPTMTIFSRTATTAWNSVKPVVTMGNLRSFVDYVADEYGTGAGNDLTLTPTTGFTGYTIDRTAGLRLFNANFSIYQSATKLIDINATDGFNIQAYTTTPSDNFRKLNWWSDIGTRTGDPVASIYGQIIGSTWLTRIEAGHDGSHSGTVTLLAENANGSDIASLSVAAGGTPSIDLTATSIVLAGQVALSGDLDMNGNDISDVGALGVNSTGDFRGILYVTRNDSGTVPSHLILRGLSDTNKLLYIGYNTTSNYGSIQAFRQGTAYDTLSLNGAGGGVAVNTTSASYALDVNGAAHASSFPTSSDARFKHIIAPISGVLDRVTALNAYTFTWDKNYSAYTQFLRADGTPQPQVGFIAQEVEQVFPDLITRWSHTGRDGVVTKDAYSVDYARMVPILVQAIRELRSELSALRSQLN
ncbi:MAG: tail fiber domain-containing protein [Nitrospiraceae bacterium]